MSFLKNSFSLSNSLARSLIALPFILTMWTSAQAQVIIVQQPGDTEDDVDSFNWVEAIDVTLLHIANVGTSLGRSTSALNVGFHRSFSQDKVRVAVNLNAQQSTLELEAVLRPDLVRVKNDTIARISSTPTTTEPWGCGANPDLVVRCDAWIQAISDGLVSRFEDDSLAYEEQVNIDFETEDATLTELYVEFLPTDSLSIKLGQFNYALGQFTFLSPAHLLTPIAYIPEATSYTKTSLLQEQLGAMVTFTPFGGLEISVAQFSETVYDPFLDTLAESRYGKDEEIETHDQSLFRAVFTAEWGAIGFTAYEGSDTLQGFIDASPIVRYYEIETFRAPNIAVADYASTVIDRGWDVDTANPRVNPNDNQAYPYTRTLATHYRKAHELSGTLTPDLQLPEVSGFAFEFAYNISNKTTLIIEYSEKETFESVFEFSAEEGASTFCTQWLTAAEYAQLQAGNLVPENCNTFGSEANSRNAYDSGNRSYATGLQNFADSLFPTETTAAPLEASISISEDPNINPVTLLLAPGSDIMKSTTSLFGIGIEHLGPKWNYTLSLVAVDLEWDDERAVELYEALDTGEDNTGVVPAMLFDRHYTAFGREAHILIGVGYVGVAAGFFATWTAEVLPGLTVSAGLEFLDRQQDTDAEEVNDRADRSTHEFAESDVTGVVGVSYKF